MDSVKPRFWWFIKTKNSLKGSRSKGQQSNWDIPRNFFGIFRQSSRMQESLLQQGILVAGCQDFETSADVAPGGKKDKAYGVLTHCLTTIVKNHYLNCPVQDEPIPLTNQQLVLRIRFMLEQMGFVQNPSLECSDDDANSYFMLG
eukprot:TRINITY_DN15938_c0_g1_i1.p2 TRINITY_DN15938_c0_g1~~TRINITY_DN15938_c0_g1_i1.p2  ORF type:complete len:161 (+),score=24.94 TRINITY_DN15938_c0_g1_i1:49-483(+)